jgi:hypothetical protein
MQSAMGVGTSGGSSNSPADGHASSEMTALYTGEIPVEQVAKHFQLEPKWTGGCSVKTSVSGEVVGRKD